MRCNPLGEAEESTAVDLVRGVASRCTARTSVASSTISRTLLPAPALAGGEDAATNVIVFKSPSDETWLTAPEKFGVIAPGMFSNVRLNTDDEGPGHYGKWRGLRQLF